ncbi:MAG: Gfo/Idh/MocA family oxidoreductase [Patescibacteria group bacterium]|jgi:predicted dehydrogenase
MRFLIIGLGSMGKRRIRNLIANDETDIVGFDVSADRRKDAEEKYQIQTVADVESVPSTEYDAIIISTPPNLHASYIRLALKEKKHFFVETTTSDEAYAEIINAPDDGTVRAPSSTFRHFAPIKKIKEILDAKRIGTVLAYQYHLGQYLPDWHPWEDYRQVFFSKKETGACRELFPFELVWLNWLVGSPVEEVCGYVTKVSDLDMDADDLMSASVKHETSVYGNILIDVVARTPFRTLRLLCTNGVIEWNWLASEISLYDVATKQTEVIQIEKGKTEEGYIVIEEMYIEEIKAFLDAIKGVRPYPLTAQDVLRNLHTLYALEESAKTKTYGRVAS